MSRQNQPSSTEYVSAIWSPPDSVDEAQDFLDAIWHQQPDVDLRDRMAIDTAFSELVSNIIQHNADRAVECRMRIRVSDDRLVLSISDSGAVFTRGLHPDDPPDQLAEAGRGLGLMETLTDAITYERRGDRNLWMLMRHRSMPTST